MDGLRWWLLFFGVLVIVGVYLYTRRERAKPQEDRTDAPRVVPTIDGEVVESDVDES